MREPTYPSDMTDAQWERLAPLAPSAKPGGRPRAVDFRRIKNFVYLEVSVSRGHIIAYVKVNPDTIALVDGFTRDVRKIGHWGTGDLEITIRNDEDFENAKPLFVRSYEAS